MTSRFLAWAWACAFIFLLVSSPAAGQSGNASPASVQSADAPLPLPSDVRTDTLANGLQLFVQANDEPDDRVELRLVVNAGSVLEANDEEGLAHFLEHMLFNGTEQFEENELVDVLERTGMKFGPDVNASTSFDRTLYTLTLPTDSTGLVEQGLDVLHQWSTAATLRPDAIDAERGIIIEEWRQSSQDAGSRIQQQIHPVLFAGSRYANRLPIGDTTDVRNVTAEQMRDFYRTWYRPNLMAVVAVGDADPDRLMDRLRTRFADLTNPEGAPPRPTYDVPDHDTTRYVVATDPEQPSTSVSVLFKKDRTPLQTSGDFREALTTRLFYRMLNQRLQERTRSGEAPFLGAGAFESDVIRPLTMYGLQARVPDDSVTVGLAALMTEAERVRQHGFTSTELVRTKRDLERAYASAFEERANQPSARLARRYVQQFLNGDAAVDVRDTYPLANTLLPQISLEDVNARATALFETKNRTVVVRMPKKDGLTPPAPDDLAAVLQRVGASEVEPYTDDATDVPLLAETPTPAKITARTERDTLGVTEITLANGVRVLIKPTDFKDDQVLIRATSVGGLSQVSNEAFPRARHAGNVVGQSGVGAFSQTVLQKKLAGKRLRISPFIGMHSEGVRGSSSPEDLETWFQLMHLYVTAPRADGASLTAYQRQWQSYLQNRARTPQAVFQDSINAALFGDHPRVATPDSATIAGLAPEPLLQTYRDRFGALGDLVVTVVGAVDADSVTTLAQTYLGSLPVGDGETARDVLPPLPDATTSVTVNAGMGDRSAVTLLYHGSVENTREVRHRLRTLQDVLSIKLREELREARSGVYNVGVNASSSGDPQNTYRVSISFQTDPDRTEELIAAARAEIDSIRAGGHVTDDDVAKVQEQQRRQYETSLESNSFWLSNLHGLAIRDDESPEQILTYGTLIDGITPETVTEAARTFLQDDRWVRAVLLPEGTTGP